MRTNLITITEAESEFGIKNLEIGDILAIPRWAQLCVSDFSTSNPIPFDENPVAEIYYRVVSGVNAKFYKNNKFK